MTYIPRMRARAHQDEALYRIFNTPNTPSSEDVFALLMEMGTGKTKVGIDEFGHREETGEIQNLLVLSGAGSYSNWCRIDDEDPGEFQKHMSEDLFDRTLVARWSSGNRAAKQRVKDIIRVTDRPRALVTNVEAISAKSSGAYEACEAFIKSGSTLMVVDESTSIKSYKSIRTKRIHALGQKAAARRIMTGLVTPKSPMDLYSQFAFLDWRIIGQRSYFAFRNKYAITRKVEMGGRRVDLIVGFRYIDELHDRIAPYSYRKLKEDCLDLEPKTYETRDVPLTSQQLQLYSDLRRYATAALDAESHVTATLVITQILRMHQILCGHVVDEEGNEHPVDNRRVDVLLDLLTEHSGKAIIWVAYRPDVLNVSRRLEEEFGEGSVATFWGGNKRTRSEEEARFKSDPDCRWMVATPDAGGKGNTWVCANLVVYYSNSYDLEKRMQSEDRAHRDGQEDRVTYIDLIARGTVDEKFIKCLRGKIDIASTIQGDNYREWLI